MQNANSQLHITGRIGILLGQKYFYKFQVQLRLFYDPQRNLKSR